MAAFCTTTSIAGKHTQLVISHLCRRPFRRDVRSAHCVRTIRCALQSSDEVPQEADKLNNEGQALTETMGNDALPRSVQTGDAARAILDDVAANPAYYLNVSGVLFGLVLSVVVLSATIVALDSIPVVPDLLRMVGLVYVFWFLAKFLFSATDRQRLTTEVDEFVAGVRGGEFRVIKGAGQSDSSLLEGDDRS